MRPYETLIVLSVDLGARTQELMERFEAIVRDGGGQVDGDHFWGLRELAYPIKKQTQGQYFLLEYTAEPDVVKELERTLRITDGVVRFMSVQQEHTGLPEERKREAGREREDVPLSELRSRPTERSGARAGEAARPAAAGETTSGSGQPATETGAEAERGESEKPAGETAAEE